MSKPLEELYQKLGIIPSSKELYELAFTHSSYNCDANTKHQDYERLEFIGDAILGFVIGDLIFTMHPELGQGQMTRVRASLVQSSSLIRHAHELGLEKYIRMGNSLGDSFSERFCEDVFEALIGAMYYDQGLDKTAEWIKKLFLEEVKNYDVHEGNDYKSELQEALQAERRAVRYQTTQESGTPNHPIFYSEVYVDGMLFGCGRGTSKKRAEQEAAKSALDKMAK